MKTIDLSDLSLDGGDQNGGQDFTFDLSGGDGNQGFSDAAPFTEDFDLGGEGGSDGKFGGGKLSWDVIKGHLSRVLAGTSVVVMLGLVYQNFANPSGDLLEEIKNLFGGGGTVILEKVEDAKNKIADTVPSGVTKQLKEVTNKAKDVVESIGSIAKITKKDMINPYWPLPNPELVKPSGLSSITNSQKIQWNLGLNHRYLAQRYLTLKNMRAARLSGSEALYMSALDQPKFWMRMEALRGLVELGFSMDVNSVDSAIGAARPALVRNYFRRLTKAPRTGDFYILRQAIRLVDGRTRLLILKSLAKQRGGVNELYLAAGTVDPSPMVTKYIAQVNRRQPVSSPDLSEFNKIVENYKNGNSSTTGTEGVEGIKIEEISIDEVSSGTPSISFFEEQQDDKIVTPTENNTFDPMQGF